MEDSINDDHNTYLLIGERKMAAGKVSKICETILMALAFFIVGINYSVLGPTLLDLQLYLKQDLETLAIIPLSSGVGETLGMVFTLWSGRLGHKRLQMSVALLVCSGVITIIPITESYIYVACMFFLVGFISGVPSCFLMDVCSELWKDKGTTFQFILVGSSMGAIITPLIVQPFLCEVGGEPLPGHLLNHAGRSGPECSPENLVTVHDACLSGFLNTSNQLYDLGSYRCSCRQLSVLPLHGDIVNSSKYNVNNTDFSQWKYECKSNSPYSSNKFTLTQSEKCCDILEDIYQCTNNTTGGESVCTVEDTNVRTAYIVLGCILLPTAFAFFYFWVVRDSKWATQVIAEEEKQDSGTTASETEGGYKIPIFYMLTFLAFLPCTALTIVFATYLTAFGVEGQLQLPKSTMVFMTSIFWMSTLAGRILSTSITPLLGDLKVLVLNFVGLVISGLLLVFLAPSDEVVLWVGTVLFGLFVCPFEGLGVAWAAHYVGMSSYLVIMSWISVSLGNLAFPYAAGIMFENIGPYSFLYLLAAMVGFQIVMFIQMVILGKYMRRVR